MRQRVLGTLTIGQAPRPDVVPIIDRHVSADIRRIHRGVLDGLSHAEIAARYRPAPGEAVLVTRLQDGSEIELSRHHMHDGVQGALAALEAEGCDAILLLCTGTFEGLACHKAWLIEPDHIIPGMVAGLVERRQLGVIVPIASQIGSESGKWRALPHPPIFAAASPYSDNTQDAVRDAGKQLKAQGAAALLLDCIGFTERHRQALLPLDLPVILSNAVAAKAVGELLGG
jgi:protein AroM